MEVGTLVTFFTLIVLGGAFGLALGMQLSRQPPQITVVHVQPEQLPERTGCAPLLIGIAIFVLLSILVSLLPQS